MTKQLPVPPSSVPIAERLFSITGFAGSAVITAENRPLQKQLPNSVTKFLTCGISGDDCDTRRIIESGMFHLTAEPEMFFS